MKKKLVSVAVAVLTAFSLGISVYAADSDPTFCFDSDSGLSNIQTFGNAEGVGLSYDISEDQAFSGAGSLAISESFTESPASATAGIYVNASDLGLTNFAGYNITANIYCTEAAAKETSMLELFTDGDIYNSVTISTAASSTWMEYTIYVSNTSSNNKFGITIPISTSFDGVVCYVDSITVSDMYGNTIANIGDTAEPIRSEGTSTVVSVLTILLFIVLIAAIVVGVALFVVKNLKKYR